MKLAVCMVLKHLYVPYKGRILPFQPVCKIAVSKRIWHLTVPAQRQ